MLWWHILFCIISIHRIVHFVRSQDEDEESTTIPISTTTNDVDEQSVARVSMIIPPRTISNLVNNGSEQNINQISLNESSKQRIIIALAVLCAALAVLLGLLISLVVCQWFQHEKDDDDLSDEKPKTRADLVGSSYNFHDHAYRQAIKL